MNGLDRITTRITHDSQKEITERLKAADEEKQIILNHAKAQAEDARSRAIAKAEAKALAMIERTTSMAELEARKILLAEKQKIVTGIFESAHEHLKKLEEGAYRRLLVGLVLRGSLSHSEQIILNQSDHQKHGTYLVKEVNRRLNLTQEGNRLTLASMTRDISGGLVLKDGPVETLCTLDVLIDQAKKDLTGQLTALLFHS